MRLRRPGVIALAVATLLGISNARALAADGTPDTAFSASLGAGFNDGVKAVAVQGDGKILVGGLFTTLVGNTSNHFARLNADGTPDATFNTNLGTGFNSYVYSIAVQRDGKIVVGGSFTTVNGVTSNYIARLNSDGTRDATFTTNLGTSFNGTVKAVAVQGDGRIVVGGQFTSLNGTTTNRVARLNADGTRDGTFTTNIGTGFNSDVSSLAVQGNGQIVVGGSFVTLNGASSSRIARLNADGTPDTAFATSLGTGADDLVQSVALQADGKIIIGGNFTTVNAAASSYLARLNADGTRDAAFTSSLGTGFNGYVYCVTIAGDGSIVAGGPFTTLNGVTNKYVARLNADGTSDTTLTSNVGAGFSWYVNALAVQGDGQVIAGGDFNSINGITSNRVARLGAPLLSGGTPDTTFAATLGTGFDNTVNSVAPQRDGKIVVGGAFTSVNGVTSKRLARLGGDGSVDGSFSANLGSGFNYAVDSLAVQPDGKILVGGVFSNVNGVPANLMARLNADGTVDVAFANNLGAGFNWTSVAGVLALTVQSDGKILVGGGFTSANGVTSRNLARLNADGTLDAAFTANLGTGFNDYVETVVVQGDGKILVGGFFSSFNGVSTNNLVRLNPDGTRDTTFPLFTASIGTGFSAQVTHVAVQGDGKIVVSGGFYPSYVRRLNADGTQDVAFNNNLGSGFNDQVLSTVLQGDGTIVAGGNFTSLNGIASNHLARLNSDGTIDNTFTANIGTGSNGQVLSLAVQADNRVISAGAFTAVNGGVTKYIARLGVMLPGVPTTVTGAGDDTRIAVSWVTPVSNGGSAIAGYQVQVATSSSGPYTNATGCPTNSAATSCTATGLTNGATYYFRVAAMNVAGTGAYSSASSGVVPVTVPAAPTGLFGTVGNGQVAVSWTAPGGTGGSAITGYRVQVATSIGGPYTDASGCATNSIATSCTATGLTNGTTYYFDVAAINAVGTGAYSSASTGITPITVPDSPTGATGTAGDSQVAVSWSAPASNGGSAITGYQVQVATSSGGTYTNAVGCVTNSTATACTATGLSNGTAYYFKVAAINTAGTGAYSSASSGVTPATVPGAPTSVTGALGNQQIGVSWTAPASTGGSPITGYQVQVATSSGGAYTNAAGCITNSTATSCTATGLTNGTTYYFKVAAINAVGTGASSSPSSGVAPATLPGVPTGVTGTGGNGQVALSWTAPASNGGSTITGYQVQVATNSGGPYANATGCSTNSVSTSCTATSLTNAATYYFTVAAINAVGTGPVSTASAGVKPTDLPGTDITSWATADISTRLSLAGTWTPFDGDPTKAGLTGPFWNVVRLGTAQRESVALGGWVFNGSFQSTLPDVTPVRAALLAQQDDGTLADATAVWLGDSTTNGAGSVLVADFNGDGFDDVVFPAHNESPFLWKASTAWMSGPGGVLTKITLPDAVMDHDARVVSLGGQKKILARSYANGGVGPALNPIYTWNGTNFSVDTGVGGVGGLGGASVLAGRFTGNTDDWLIVGGSLGGPGVPYASTNPMLNFAYRFTGGVLTTPPVSLPKPYFNDKPAYAGFVSEWDPYSKTHTSRLWLADLNQDGLPDILAGQELWSASVGLQKAVFQLLINRGNMTFEDQTDALLPEFSQDSFIDYNVRLVDVDGSGIESMFLASNQVYVASDDAPKQGQYILVNDGAGHLYAAMHPEFRGMRAQIAAFLTNHLPAGSYVPPDITPQFIAYRTPAGAINFVAVVKYSAPANVPAYAFVNVPLGVNLATDFRRNLTIQDRNGSHRIRTFAGDDTIYAATDSGHCHIDGGLGTNTMVYPGPSANYSLVQNADSSWTITDLVGSGGTDTLARIQRLQFADRLVVLADLPVFTTEPTNVVVTAGQPAQFTAAANGSLTYRWQVSTDAGTTWGDIGSSSAYTGVTTYTLLVPSTVVGLNGDEYRCVATNGAGSTTSTPAILTVNPATVPASMALDRTALAFAATTDGVSLISRTSDQVVRMTQSGTGTVTWTAVSSAPWLTVSPASGTGSASFAIGVQFATGLPTSGSASGTVTVALTGSANSVGPINVTLTVTPEGKSTSPFGSFDTPADGTTAVTGSIAVTGWSLDDVGVTRIRILRDPLPGEGTALVFIGNAIFVEGARSDIAAAYTTLPMSTRAGWGYLMLTNFLPNQGNGTFKLHAIADDADGHSVELGTKTITCDNAHATTPFGAIDTPAQGATVSGTINNFGWTLINGTPHADPPGGGTVNVVIDGAVVGTPTGWTSRSDLTTSFPAGFTDLNSALAVLPIDTTALANGVHTIAWGVTATNGQAAGVGSRYFTVSNGALYLDPGPSVAIPNTSAMQVPPSAGMRLLSSGSIADAVNAAPLDSAPIEGRRGYDLDATSEVFSPLDGIVTIESAELDRIELHLGGPGDHAFTGYLRTRSGLAPLPIGSALDAATGHFTWQPGVAFVGMYDLVFVDWPGGRAAARREIRLVLNPKSGSTRAR